MKKSIFTFALSLSLLASALLPTNNAQAGVVLIAGGSPFGVVSGLVIGVFVYENAFEKSDENVLRKWRSNPINATLGALVYTSFIVLDEDAQSKVEYETVPLYLLEEIRDFASKKSEGIKADEHGMKVVSFTEAEVDSLLELADDFTDQVELDHLREALLR